MCQQLIPSAFRGAVNERSGLFRTRPAQESSLARMDPLNLNLTESVLFWTMSPSIRKESPGGHVLCKAPASVMLCSENVGTRRGAGEQKSSHFPIKFSLMASYAQGGPQAILFSLLRCCSHVLCCVMCSNQDANNTHQYKSSCVPFWLDRIWAQAAVEDQF